MTLKELIERGYFPKELPPPFDTADLAADISATLASWTTVFSDNTMINSPTFVLIQAVGETSQTFKERKFIETALFQNIAHPKLQFTQSQKANYQDVFFRF